MCKEGDMIICRCEEVSLNAIVSTVEKYNCSSREVKLRTRAGMGYCGGRTCRPLIEQLVQEATKIPLKNESDLSYRPPVRPVTFGDLGGESYDNENYRTSHP